VSLADWFQEQAASGSLLLAVPVAATAGLVSFFSPCVVPLLPGYISYATGLSGADLQSAKRSRMVTGTSLFVLGFTFVFMVEVLFFGAIGQWLFEQTDTLNVVLGIVTIVLGLVFLGVVPYFQRDVRLHKVPAVGLAAAPMLGVLFALGWTPCIGPTLQVVVSMASNESTQGRGLLLGLAYSLGLGIPFVIAGFAFERTLGAVRWVRRHQAWVTRFGGLLMIVVGVLLLTGLWQEWIGQLQGWAATSETGL
jgi:cytochrome c-type biogenesis protein